MSDETPITNPTVTTPKAAYAWRPDHVGNLQNFDIEGALAQRLGTVVFNALEGDQPRVRIPWLDDSAADVVPEGEEFDPGEPTLSEIEVATVKIGKLLKISREQLSQPGAARMLSQSANLALVTKADQLLLTSDGTTAPVGIFKSAATKVLNNARNLDAYSGALATLESFGATNIQAVVHPNGWAMIQQLKTGDGSQQPLLGAGVEAGERRLFGVDVIVTPAAPVDGELAFIDKTALAVVLGPIVPATSSDFYFGSDNIAMRATLRLGWKVADETRVIRVAAPPAPEGE